MIARDEDRHTSKLADSQAGSEAVRVVYQEWFSYVSQRSPVTSLPSQSSSVACLAKLPSSSTLCLVWLSSPTRSPLSHSPALPYSSYSTILPYPTPPTHSSAHVPPLPTVLPSDLAYYEYTHCLGTLLYYPHSSHFASYVIPTPLLPSSTHSHPHPALSSLVAHLPHHVFFTLLLPPTNPLRELSLPHPPHTPIPDIHSFTCSQAFILHTLLHTFCVTSAHWQSYFLPVPIGLFTVGKRDLELFYMWLMLDGKIYVSEG